MKPQAGVALVVALVILVPLTLIAVTLMQVGGVDLRIASAGTALQQVEGRLEGVIDGAIAQSALSSRIGAMAAQESWTVDNSQVTLLLRNESVCKRKFDASSQNVIPTCRYAELQVSEAYGRRSRGMSWTAGIEQPLLKGK